MDTARKIDLERDIANAVKDGIAKQIETVLASSYNSPINKYINEVVAENGADIKRIMSEAFQKIVNTDEFRAEIVEAFQHKVAKAMVGHLEGSVAKAVDVFRSDPTIRAKMVLAIEEIVKQNLPRKDS